MSQAAYDPKSGTINFGKNEMPVTEVQQSTINPTGFDTSINQAITTPKEVKYGETQYRWFFLACYCLSVFVNQMQWVAYAAILTEFSEHYEKPQWKVNLFALIFLIEYPLTCIPEAWMLDKFSIRISLMIAAACNIIGSGLKLFVNKDKSLASCYVGQAIAGLFQPVLLNSPGKVSANWFREDIRTVICTVCCLAVTIGALVGFLWNLIFVNENAPKEKYKDQVFNYFFSEFMLNVVFCLPTFFITKNKPEIPPSPSQEEIKEKEPGFCESLKLLFTNFRFICLFVSYFLVVGYFDIMSTIINSLLDLYSITSKQSSVIYAVASIAGIIASLIISWLLDKYKKFKLIMIILSVLGAIFQGLFTLLLELIDKKNLNAYAIGLTMYSLINMCIISFYTIGMNYACEITYPVGESISGSIMASTPQLLAIGLTFLCEHFIDHNSKRWISNVILLILISLSIIFVILLDEKLQRNEIEQLGRMKEKNMIDNKGNLDNQQRTTEIVKINEVINKQ